MARPRLEQLREAVEERVGISIRARDTVATLEESAEQFKTFAAEASEMAYQALTHLHQRPHEMPRERRNRIAQKARQAFVSDPLAGREVEMLADFALGNGVAMAEAKDKEVQEVIREAWKDANNQEKLTSFDAQRALSNTLRTDANLYLTGYRGNGKFRVGLVDGDSVTDFVPDPEDRLRPLWYVTKTRKIEWDFDKDVPKVVGDGEGGQPKEKVTYYPHWRNYAEAVAEREARDEPALQEPPKEKKDPGEAVIFHLRINRLTEQIFGTPPFARSLRFYSAMNQFTESRVAKAQAAATFVARNVLKGGPKQLAKSAQSVLQQTGELGTSGGFGEDRLDEPARRKNPSPGSFLFQNEQEKLESLNLSTGGGEAQADAQIIRAPLAASSGFGQHYLGDASNANLATATTLELPVLMMVQAWQEVLEQLFRWFTDMAIEEAVRSGRLGGAGNRGDGDKPLSELRLTEAEDKAEAEKRTGKDLSYTFEMPYPGRRNLPDVLATATTMLGIPTLGTNEELTKVILGFVLSHGLQLAEPTDTLEAIMKEWRKAREEADKQAEEQRQAAIAQMQGGDPNAPSNASDDDEGSQHGEKRRGKDPSGDMGEELEHVPVDLRPGVEMLDAEVDELFRELVADPALRALAGSRNGNGN